MSNPNSTPSPKKPQSQSKPLGALSKFPAINNLLNLVKTSPLKFAWFIGNVITSFAALLYFISYRSPGIANQIWYRLILLSALETFGITIYNSPTFVALHPKSLNILAILEDDNFHYFYIALIWLVLPLQFTLAIIPFFIFSMFHSVTYTCKSLFPAIGVPENISSFFKSFASKYLRLYTFIAGTELLLLVFLILRCIFFRKLSIISLILFAPFIKLKTETSIVTQTILQNWEVRLDGLVALQTVPPAVRTGWGTFKKGLRGIGQYNLVGGSPRHSKGE